MPAWSRRLRRAELPLWDKDFVRLHLDERSQVLFFQMNPADQRHALAVAKTVLAKRGYQAGVPVEPLVQAALLHDVGKIDGDMPTLARLVVSLVRRVAPGLRAKWANRAGNMIGRACYVDLVHPRRGAYMARTFGVAPEVAAIIRSHHDLPQPGEPKILTYLREADNRN